MKKREWFKQVRKEYLHSELIEDEIGTNPWKLFADWINESQKQGLIEPNAFALATVSASGQPTSRMLLMKHFESSGIIFFTNYNSRKGKELELNSRATALFYWPELERQVRIEGKVTKVTRKESEHYFSTRPRGAQLSAYCSAQSQVISSREQLLKSYKQITKKFAEQAISCPIEWGGYRLKPQSFEFWQGRQDKLHDRIRFVRKAKSWKRERLAP